MPLKHILGLDHVVVTVRDLDASARQWQSLGFTVSPRGTHSAFSAVEEWLARGDAPAR